MGQLPTLKKTILLPHLNPLAQLPKTELWTDVLKTPAATLEFTPVPFQHPLWILFDAPTTDKPKKITHSVGGCLLEHLKTFTIHQNVKLGERFFWYGNSSSLEWNFSLASMLVGATPVLYEGAAPQNVLWDIVEKAKINHFGIATAYFAYNFEGNESLQSYKFNQLQSITLTDSVLAVEGYEWVYQNIKKDVWVISFTGNAELCSSFSGGCSSLPIFANETQCRLLGCKLENYGGQLNSVHNELRETNLSQPMPSMPLVG
jgi:acetoacetyl-CoA synthetase